MPAIRCGTGGCRLCYVQRIPDSAQNFILQKHEVQSVVHTRYRGEGERTQNFPFQSIPARKQRDGGREADKPQQGLCAEYRRIYPVLYVQRTV